MTGDEHCDVHCVGARRLQELLLPAIDNSVCMYVVWIFLQNAQNPHLSSLLFRWVKSNTSFMSSEKISWNSAADLVSTTRELLARWHSFPHNEFKRSLLEIKMLFFLPPPK